MKKWWNDNEIKNKKSKWKKNEKLIIIYELIIAIFEKNVFNLKQTIRRNRKVLICFFLIWNDDKSMFIKIEKSDCKTFEIDRMLTKIENLKQKTSIML